MPTTHFNATQAAAQITRDGYSWSASLGTAPTTLTYGFRATAPDFGSTHNEDTTFARVTDAEKTAIATVMSLWADVADISFRAISPTGYTDNATMLFANYTNSGDGSAAFAHYPSWSDTDPLSTDGDVWINTHYTSTSALGYGTYAFQTLLHEVGHALGLDHPGNYNAGPGVVITYSADASYVEDTRQYTVMSYFNAFNTGASHTAAGSMQFGSTPLLHDIAAIQRLYGANMLTRYTDTVYGFHSTAGRSVYDFNVNKTPVLAIWDAGGTDTLDVSGYTMAQSIDLRQGAFSNVGGMTKNIAIAMRAVIENASGGSGVDIITGNSGANSLFGNAGNDILRGLEGADRLLGGDGNDTLDGGTGNDRMAGGAGDDTYVIDALTDVVIETDANVTTGGRDTIKAALDITLASHIENLILTGTGALKGTGNALSNSMTGNSAANMLEGGAGNDRLDGGAGADRLVGGDGNDVYIVDHAGDGIVESSTTAAGASDKVLSSVSYKLAANVEALTLTGITAIDGTGNNAANTLTGNAAANKLSGLAGGDTLLGGGGQDELNGGAGRDVLTGGVAADRFVYKSVADAGKGATRDVIRDFTHSWQPSQSDVIDLSAIDADGAGGAANGKFVLKSTSEFSGLKGELHVVRHNGLGVGNEWTVIEGDVNGDKVADFQIQLSGLKSLLLADFVL